MSTWLRFSAQGQAVNALVFKPYGLALGLQMQTILTKITRAAVDSAQGMGMIGSQRNADLTGRWPSKLLGHLTNPQNGLGALNPNTMSVTVVLPPN